MAKKQTDEVLETETFPETEPTPWETEPTPDIEPTTETSPSEPDPTPDIEPTPEPEAAPGEDKTARLYSLRERAIALRDAGKLAPVAVVEYFTAGVDSDFEEIEAKLKAFEEVAS
jgi:hypothetical protein